MAAIRNLGFSNFYIFGQPSHLGGLICIAVTNFIKIGQTGAEISPLTIFIMCHHTNFQQHRPNGFGDIAIFRFSRWPPSAILGVQFLNFWSPIRLGGLMCIAVPNFIKIGQTVVVFNFFFKMAAVWHLRFCKNLIL